MSAPPHPAIDRDLAQSIAALDAPACPLGPIASWSSALRNAVDLLLPAAAEIVLFWGPDYVALYNDAYAPTIGTKHPAALGRPAREAWAELWDDLEPLLADVRRTGKTFSDKDRAFYMERFGYGETIYFDISYSAVRDDDGSVGGVLCIVAETTERVRATRAVAAERERMVQMFDQAPSFMAVLREPGHVYEIVNASYLQLVGHRDLIGKTIRETLPELESQGYFELLDSVAATGQPHRASGAKVTLQRTRDAQPEERFVDFIFQPVTDSQGHVTAIFVEGSDVTDRLDAEARLSLSEESLRLATDAAEIGTWDLDPLTDRLEWSDRTKAMFGHPPGAHCTMDDFYQGLHPDDRDATTSAFSAALDPATRAIYDVEYRTIGAADGAIRWVAAKGRGLFEDDRCVRAIGTTIDITQRRRVLEELRESEARFRQLADSAPALIWVTNDRADIVFANRGFETLLGKTQDEVLGHGWRALIAPSEWSAVGERMIAVFHRREPWSADLKVIDADGAVRWVHAEGRPRVLDGEFQGYVGCAVDVTDAHLAGEALERVVAERTTELADSNRALIAQIAERERVEATLHQMQRLEAVGQLTAGVAHDFNNLLTVVLGNVAMIQRAGTGAALDERMVARLGHIQAAAERGAALTAQLLAFSRRQRLEARPLDLNATVAGMRDMLASSIGNAITITLDLAPDLWPAMVDPTQIELVILNLAINARDAMSVGGTVTITTANVTRGEPERVEDPPAGDHVVVTVADTGSGMTAVVLAQVFEPFFTTKEVGRGSGLGLAQVFGFAKQSGGGVRIHTVPGEGTRVLVYLPRSPDAPVTVDAPIASGERSIAGTRVLVVDDEADVRAVTADTLGAAGCVVIEAASGHAALAQLEDGLAIDLVVADFAMPGMNGAELAARIAARWPAVPLLMLTGYADLPSIASIVDDDAVIQKPFDPATLHAHARRLLDRPRPH